MTRRVMVDIETLGLEPGAAILSIGAVNFDAGKMGETFERSVSRKSCESYGLKVDADTLKWWRDQDDEAADVLEGGEPLDDVLNDLQQWIDGADEVWANPPKFDAAMLEAAGEAVNVEMPWEYYELRDFRTLKALPLAPDVSHDGIEHDALDDATHQAHVAAATLKAAQEAAGSTTKRRDSE